MKGERVRSKPVYYLGTNHLNRNPLGSVDAHLLRKVVLISEGI